MRPLLALPALLLAPSMALAQAGQVSAGDPETVRSALVAWGHKARLEPLETGEPMIAARTAEGINYVIYFYGCENGQGCLDLQFMASFTVEPAPTVQAMNDFNAEWVMGKAFLDSEGAPSVTFTVVGDPAMSPEYFQSVMEVWEQALATFTEEIGW